MWVRHHSFHDTVRDSWLQPTGLFGMRNLEEKLDRLRRRLRQWNWDVFGNLHQRFAAAQSAHATAERAYDLDPTPENRTAMHRCHAEYQLRLLMEEDFWKQKAAVRWVAEGERNSRIFQGYVRQKRAKSYIHSIEAEGSSLTQEAQIRKSAVAHFQTLFTSDRGATDNHLRKPSESASSYYRSVYVGSFPSEDLSVPTGNLPQDQSRLTDSGTSGKKNPQLPTHMDPSLLTDSLRAIGDVHSTGPNLSRPKSAPNLSSLHLGPAHNPFAPSSYFGPISTHSSPQPIFTSSHPIAEPVTTKTTSKPIPILPKLHNSTGHRAVPGSTPVTVDPPPADESTPKTHAAELKPGRWQNSVGNIRRPAELSEQIQP
ncbi:DNAse I-like superfamily protein [Striga asiatica]|uniref:DNAse I-like superfamily protein n=1 Tax=Striga asiatica TaxID=4170 RepID=A0A5A7P992_STRAF|nr:DNAse I-like superfamily protein [Striga asiatica]